MEKTQSLYYHTVSILRQFCCENRSCYSYRKYGTDSLSSKFRVDKLAINNRINDHIISDIFVIWEQ